MEHTFCGNCIEGEILNLPLKLLPFVKIIGWFHSDVGNNKINDLSEVGTNVFEGKVFQSLENPGRVRFVFHPKNKWLHVHHPQIRERGRTRKGKKRSLRFQLRVALLFLGKAGETPKFLNQCESASFLLTKSKRGGCINDSSNKISNLSEELNETLVYSCLRKKPKFFLDLQLPLISEKDFASSARMLVCES